MILGLPLSDWVYVITIIYTFVGICTMIKKHWVEPWLEKKRKEKNNGL
nr:MAG TPA: holin [Caudoviricetes sp.]